MNARDSRHLARNIALLVGLGALPAPAAALGLLVPAYQYPSTGTLWADCAAAAARVPLVAVVNPASGPGPAADPLYSAAIAAVRANGGRVIAYIATFDGARHADSVAVEASRYLAQYPVDGFFLDIMSNAPDPVRQAYYADLGARLRTLHPGALLVGNPGTQTLPEYMAGVDIVCNHENFGEAYFAFEPSPWVLGFAPSRFVHLVHSLSTTDSMRAAVQRAATRHAQWVFVTPDTMPNPWDLSPGYWSALVDEVAATPIAGVAPAAPGRVRAWPSPGRGLARFAGAGIAGGAIRIADANGRVVRVLPAGAMPAWDGCDARGRRVAPGVYFASGTAAGGRWRARVVRLE